jgi:hypothetical protein
VEAVSNAEVAAKALMREVGKVIKKKASGQKQSKSLLQTSVFFPLSG